MSKKIRVDDEINIIETTHIDTKTIEEYLTELAGQMAFVDAEIKIIQEEINQKNELIEHRITIKTGIQSTYDELLQNRKTAIKKKASKNIKLNNLLSKTFPKDFKFKEMPKQKITTETDLICHRIVKRVNKKTKKLEKYKCTEEFTTLKKFLLHVALHKKKGELI